jgi:Putative MetA-pathway of phenol degradation
MKVLSLGICVAGLAWASGAVAEGSTGADDASGSLASGYSYSSGKYGTATTTTIETVPLLGSVSVGDLTFDANVPYLSVNGDPNVIPGLGKVNNTNPKKRGNGAARGSGSGLGDVVLSATYDFYSNEAAKFGFDVTGSAKLGTGDKNQGLGTGATDYTIEIGAYKSVGELSLNGSLGYTAVGSSNYVKLKKNQVLVAFGGVYKIDEDWSVGADFDSGGQGAHSVKVLRSVSGVSTRTLTEYVTYKFSGSWKLELYALEGLSNASPDFGGGALVTLSF